MMGEGGRAFVSVAAELELAVAGGKLRPRRQELARGPASGRPPAPGGCRAGAGGAEWLEVVMAAERLSAWARSHGEARRALVSDPEALWYAVAHRLGRGPRLRPMVPELALLLLGEAGEVTEATLVEEVGAGAVGESWPAADRRTADCPRPAGRSRYGLLEVLGLRRAGGKWRSRWLRSPSRAERSPWRRCMPAPPVPHPTGAAHDPCDRRWRWRARLGERTGTP